MALLDRTFPLLGRRLPFASLLVMVVTLVGSIAATNSRVAEQTLALFPGALLQGQVWRLFTWAFAMADPIGLLWWGLLIFFISPDLVYAFKPRRFLLLYLGLAAATAFLMALLALAYPPLQLRPYFAPWVLADALLVGWGVLFPNNQILLMLVLPVQGRQLVLATFGATLIVGAMSGFLGVLPHFLAMGLMLAYLRERTFETAWLKLRYRWLQLRAGRRRGHLRAVERDDDRPRWVH